MTRWMLNCRDYAKLASEGLDRPLSWWDRISMTMHRLMCPPCNLIKQQMESFRKACRFVPSDNPDEIDKTCVLPDDARMRIKKVLRERLKS
jgi:hypothetical protein